MIYRGITFEFGFYYTIDRYVYLYYYYHILWYIMPRFKLVAVRIKHSG